MVHDERRLWERRASAEDEEQWSDLPAPLVGRVLRNVVEPTLTAYLPETTSPLRQAVVVAPGGGLHFLDMDREGTAVGRWLQERGIAALVLKYRVVPTPADDAEFEAALRSKFAGEAAAARDAALRTAVADAGRSIEVLRSEGVEQVAYLGFSAGARIGAELVMRGPAQQRPDVAGFAYLHSIPDVAVAPDAVPLFLLAAADDPLGIEGSIDLHAAWRAGGHPVELHLFERGGHGFGLGGAGDPVDGWPDLFVSWLRQRGFETVTSRRTTSSSR